MRALLEQWGELFSERLNPLVVKEMRQGLRAKTFWLMFGALLVLCLLISIFALVAAADEERQMGSGLFTTFLVVSSVVQLFILPYSAFRGMAREQEDETWLLLTLTGLGARRIVAGKVISTLLQSVLYFSAIGPFFLFSYFLNGIDLVSIVLRLTLSGALQVFLIVACICAATLVDNKALRTAAHFIVLGALLMSFLFWSTGISIFDEIGRRNGEMLMFGLTSFAFLLVSGGVLLFEAGVSRLSLSSERYTRGPRLAFLFQLLGLLAFCLWGWWLASTRDDALISGVVVMLIQTYVVGYFLVNQVEPSSQPTAKPQSWSLLKPGVARAYILTLLAMFVAPLVLWLVAKAVAPDEATVTFLAVLPAQAMLHLSVPLLLSSLTRFSSSNRRLMMHLLTVFQFIVGAFVTAIARYGFSSTEDELGVMTALVPLLALRAVSRSNPSRLLDDGNGAIVFVWAVTGVMVALTLLALRHQSSNNNMTTSLSTQIPEAPQ